MNQYNNSIPCEIQGFVPISYDIPPPKRMRERFDFYQNLVKEGEFILVETPDLYEFANEMDVIRNKEEFTDKIKLLSMRRGMRVNIPHGGGSGSKQGTYYVQCSGYNFNSVMTKDLCTKKKITLPDGTEKIEDDDNFERPRWPFKNEK